MESIQATTELCFKVLMTFYYWVVDNFAIADAVYTCDITHMTVCAHAISFDKMRRLKHVFKAQAHHCT